MDIFVFELTSGFYWIFIFNESHGFILGLLLLSCSFVIAAILPFTVAEYWAAAVSIRHTFITHSEPWLFSTHPIIQLKVALEEQIESSNVTQFARARWHFHAMLGQGHTGLSYHSWHIIDKDVKFIETSLQSLASSDNSMVSLLSTLLSTIYTHGKY